ncbi:electron transfer flavoprotein subunit beta/FixA family protein [Gudongella sp. DL1XJH-153]|uniref:electron transfer flavoprotein subunit beta/FixA family protein n=1 Tax=Gudongella sp. DL1XJH-153 TaxID=3409804 RepID=UPI003BB4D840
MRIAVCIKQVPTSNEVLMDPETKTIIRDGKNSVINPYDSFAVEEAISIKEKTNAEVVAITMGIPEAESILRDSIARGVDRGMLLSDRNFAGADTLATSYTLSLGIYKLGEFDIILCGKLAIDGDTSQIGPELAEHLGVPHVTDVEGFIEVDEKMVLCKKNDGNSTKILEVKLPALFTINKDINNPRMPSIAGVLRSLESSIEMHDSNSLNADERKIGLNGSPTQVVRTFMPESEKVVHTISGGTKTQSLQILSTIKEVI